MEIEFGINFDDRVCLLGKDVLRYIILETPGKCLDILYLQREARCICMPTEVLEQVAAALHGLIYVEARD